MQFAGLTDGMCAHAWDIIKPAVDMAALPAHLLNKNAGHVVVLDPRIPYEPKYRGGPAQQEKFSELVLWGHEFAYNGADRELLPTYRAIARAKAFGSFMTGLPSHQVQQVAPALYVPGMTKWGGSAVYGPGPARLIVAFSGVQWHFDQMISEWMLSTIMALCHDEMIAVMESDEDVIPQIADAA